MVAQCVGTPYWIVCFQDLAIAVFLSETLISYNASPHPGV